MKQSNQEQVRAEHTKAWKGHEVLIATHIDKGHIHTHFIVNSVNYENGHKLQWM
ncbi:TPA: relaxase/mobilization nuclease domain-containing protein [Streptococcus suis]|nr:relaxase/mobilization nuclease domain-containing protein [Streptococcus suis]HEL1741512.1 relaxase/mobilization nuclease domain-containing protein [Streptococcus suis]